jgi:Mn-dependent DtxR family transcriptional regulator
METLQRLTRRQLDTLRFVASHAVGDRGLGLSGVAEGLGVRPPSALEHLSTLEALGLVERFRGKSRATRRGLACLDEYLRHHRVAESLFARAGLSVEATHAAALEVDLALSHHTVQRICEGEGHPEVCPHGEPIAPCASPRRPRTGAPSTLGSPVHPSLSSGRRPGENPYRTGTTRGFARGE